MEETETAFEISGSFHSVKLLDELARGIDKTFDQVYQYQKQHGFGVEDQIPPNRLPLKRRLAEFRHHQPLGNREADPRFSASSAIEKFRDITPAFVVAIFEETLVFEPGDVGPISMGHPVAQDLISAINKQELTPSLMGVLQDSGAPFYDGCLVVGIVDYRRLAFGVIGAGPHVPIVRKECSVSNGSGPMPYRNPTIAPEMHKILLKPSSASLMADIDELLKAFPTASSSPDELALELEAQILLATKPALCLDPDPFVGEALTAFNYDRNKMKAFLQPLSLPQRPVPTSFAASNVSSSKASGRVGSVSGGARLKFADVIEGERASKRSTDAEPFYGLDVKKDPGRFKDIPPNTPLFAWVQPNQRLWRTIRFESPLAATPTHSSQSPPPPPSKAPKRLHYTIHLLLNTAGHFDVIFRKGSAAFTAINGETIRFRLANRLAADAYIERLQFMMALDGNACVGDVSNPTIFNNASMPGTLTAGGRIPSGIPAAGGPFIGANVAAGQRGPVTTSAVPPPPMRGNSSASVAGGKPAQIPAGLNPSFSIHHNPNQLPQRPPKK